MPLFRKYKKEIALFLLAIVARLIFFFVCLSANGGDVITTVRGQDWYFEISRNLILGNGFSAETTPPFTPYSYGVPGYPYFLYFLLLLTGGSYALAAMIQLVLSAFIPLLGMYLARLVTPAFYKYRHVPFAVGMLLALAPYQILHSFIFFTETLFTALFVGFLILFVKYLQKPSARLALASGFVLGLSTLVKPTVQYVPILVGAFILWRFLGERKKSFFVQLGCFLAIFFLVLSPWLYRNYRTFHVFNLSAQVSFNLYTTLLPSVLAIEHHSTFQSEQGKLPPIMQDSLFGAGESVPAQILSHPIALVKLAALSAFTFFTHDGMLTFLQSAGVTPSAYLSKPAIFLILSDPIAFTKTIFGYLHTGMAPVLVMRLFWIALTSCFILGLFHLFYRHLATPGLFFLIILVFYFMLTTMINGLTVNARFRVPVEPIIFMVAMIGLVPIYQRAKQVFHAKHP
ncbi:MAG: glycosyltransferase family 39 protein [Parcubacteria group bacterium]|nr:glycosyltransferase family 39 protein [Parcubacteria group bacterium]